MIGVTPVRNHPYSFPLSVWWLGLAPEFWVRFPNERNQEKQAHPVSKYRVPHGSHPRVH